MAVLENNGPTLVLRGAKNIVIEGFELRHAGPTDSKHLAETARKSDSDIWSEEIIFRNNIFHDSYNNDLLKIYNGSRFITVENNVFYNQGPNEQHMDVNSVTDVVIQDNIFFNDFPGSGRPIPGDTKHFIVIKDSRGEADGLVGSERVTVRRNVFLNWSGGNETFVKVGNDGNPYHEAEDVLIENNLMIGNSPDVVSTVFGAHGAKNVLFRNNTVVGDLPSKSYAFRVGTKDLNPQNENISFINNIWSDPTGTMGAESAGETNEFSDGDPSQTSNLVLDNNLYWNGGAEIPPGDLVSPLQDDPRPIVADPLLNYNHGSIVLPRWNGLSFMSGSSSIREEFVRLVEAYGKIPAESPSVGQADPAQAPSDDILGHLRPPSPGLGAYESQEAPAGSATPTETATNQPLPSSTSTLPPTFTPPPPDTPLPTNTPLPPETNTPVASATNTVIATSTPLATSTATATPTDQATLTATPVPTAEGPNLALEQPVTTSSQKSPSHGGPKAVDGRESTYWEFAKPKGQDAEASQWILVDLEGLYMVNQVTLMWGKFFAPSYELQVSADGDSWKTISTVDFVDGLRDDNQFDSQPVRFVKMLTSAGRSQLVEIQVFGDGSILQPISTPIPTATTGSGESNSLHVGDLDGSAIKEKSSWTARTAILIHDSAHNPIAGAVVRGTWSGGFNGTVTCTTDSKGICTVETGSIPNKEKSVFFNLDSVIYFHPSPYVVNDNHDPDGDSNGLQISIPRP
jgi:hypothetical protein